MVTPEREKLEKIHHRDTESTEKEMEKDRKEHRELWWNVCLRVCQSNFA